MKILLPRKTLLLVWGYPWVGKTYLSQKIVQQYCFCYIDKDVLNDVYGPSRMDEKYDFSKEYVRRTMFALAASNLDLDNSVLLDSPFWSKRLWDKERVRRIQDFALSHHAHLKMVRCIANADTRKKRLLTRNLTRDQERFHEIDSFVAKEKTYTIPFEHILYDTEIDNEKKLKLFLESE